jgi:hypothetical protein
MKILHVKQSRRKWRCGNSKAYRAETKLLEKQQEVRDTYRLSYKQKILRFYNPLIHTVYNTEEFVDLFIEHLEKNGDYLLANWVREKKPQQCQFVFKLVKLKSGYN